MARSKSQVFKNMMNNLNCVQTRIEGFKRDLNYELEQINMNQLKELNKFINLIDDHTDCLEEQLFTYIDEL